MQKCVLILRFEQFEVHGQWVPPVPMNPWSKVESEVVIENVVGIWLGKTFVGEPVQIGTVVSRPTNKTVTKY